MITGLKKFNNSGSNPTIYKKDNKSGATGINFRYAKYIQYWKMINAFHHITTSTD